MQPFLHRLRKMAERQDQDQQRQAQRADDLPADRQHPRQRLARPARPDACTRVSAKAKTSKRHQQVEDPFQDPSRELGRDRHAFLHGDQVGPNELAGPAEQRDRGKADQRWRTADCVWTAWASAASERPPSAAPVRNRCRTSGSTRGRASSSAGAPSSRRPAPIEAARRQLGADEPHEPRAGEDDTAGDPFPRMLSNRRLLRRTSFLESSAK